LIGALYNEWQFKNCAVPLTNHGQTSANRTKPGLSFQF